MTMQRLTMVVVAVLMTLSTADAVQKTYYVNPDCGDDAWTALSDVCTAPDGPKKTIQPAIDATAPGDTVVLADGTYYMGGDPITFGGKDITLRSANGAENCVINGQGTYLAFQFNSGESINSRLVGITVYNCGGGARSERGGGVSIMDAGLTIENCIFQLNENAIGGAVYCANSELMLTNCEFSLNTAWATECDTQGGAVYGRDSTVQIENCYFSENDGWYGVCHGGNGGSSGGAMTLNQCESVIVGCIFTNNMVTYHSVSGGALALQGGSTRIERCAFISNKASGEFASGGAVTAYQTDLRIENCEFSRNSASGSQFAAGGAITLGGKASIVNSTFARNGGSDESGALSISGSGSVISNSVFTNNSSGNDSTVSVFNGTLEIEYSYFEKGSSSVLGLPTWGAGNIFLLDPGFVSNGSFRLDRNSPLIDAGDSSAVTIPPMPAIARDLDGNPRLKDDPGTPDTGIAPVGMHVVDIGCYEFQGSSCTADCDWSTGPGVLDIFDFLCFQNAFVSGDPLACDCDTSTGIDVCDIFDFLCFQNAFVKGCP